MNQHGLVNYLGTYQPTEYLLPTYIPIIRRILQLLLLCGSPTSSPTANRAPSLLEVGTYPSPTVDDSVPGRNTEQLLSG
jgi:hypothetical protein